MDKYSFDILRPDPEKEVNSLRAFGYSIETAIADLLDNSVSANASYVSIVYSIDTLGSYVRIEDNGVGMSEDTLINAMKLGSFNPSDERGEADLGRFGLGLKTASFSQCKRLSVITRSYSSSDHTRVWDLDRIQEEKEWILYRECLDLRSKEYLGKPLGKTGTIVLWEKLDRLAETENIITDKSNFYRKFEDVKKYLRLVFHRFIEQEKLVISVNGEILSGINPFTISDEKPSRELQESKFIINGAEIRIQPYILPHEAKLSKKEQSYYDIIRSWIEHQGIYLYRNDRLIIDGSWMDLRFRQRESQRLVRICIDITNRHDKEFHIDVKKASAKIPDAIRRDISRICESAIVEGIKVYTHRGAYVRRKGEKKELIYTWLCKSKQGVRHYIINPQHPLFILISDLLGDHYGILSSYIKTIEEAIPLGIIINDSCDEHTIIAQMDNSENRKIYNNLLTGMIASGVNHETAEETLRTLDIFSKF